MDREGERSRQPRSAACDGRSDDLRLPAHVVANRRLGGLVSLSLRVPGWPGARPGQFAMVRTETSSRFFARPLSISDESGDHVSFLVAAVGEATRELCALGRGAALWVLGPLGNGFDVEALAQRQARLVVVAGGVGAAPFPLLLQRLAAVHGASSAAPAETTVILGFRDSEQYRAASVVIDVRDQLAVRGWGCLVETAVEDGSRGPAERVTDLLRRRLRPGDQVVACGPWAMCEAVWGLCSRVAGVEAWFSLETVMACGVGSCHGCVITLADGSYARVCREGPVFSGKEVFGG